MADPKHKIYASNGSTLVYTINDVIKREPPIVIDVPNYIEISNLRASGCLTISGGNKSYDIIIVSRISGANYTELMTNLTTLKSTVVVNTNYYLKWDKTLVNDESLESIKVRLISLDIPSENNLTKFCYVTMTFKTLCW